jgi:hypothetical protein
VERIEAGSQGVSLGSSIITGLILSPIFRYNDFINLLKKTGNIGMQFAMHFSHFENYLYN